MTSFQRKTGLGRGLSALLDDNDATQPARDNFNATSEGAQVGNISHVNIAEIETNPYQPRTEFDAEALGELADSIKVQGLIQPITVRKLGANKYQIISGERRFRASKLAGISKIPAYIRGANDQQMLEMALIENIQRENLNAIEVALSFQRMIDEIGLKQEELSGRVGKSRSTVTNYLRLLKLPPVVQASIRDQKISMGHARAIINVDGVDKQLFIHQQILEKGLSVRKVEELVRNLQHQSREKANKGLPDKLISFQHRKLQDDLASKFATRVKLKVGENGKGAIEIPFLNDDDLNRILELLDW
ncbi:ParB family chromosome partitioning protein [Pedobacter sp. UYP30]|uniref:ParB/RepB/Spo0J family partition protein n=1 Tax=Pedobacter sp. UYP30 TaxID=1756400 RepID=UPI0033949EF3